MKKLIFKMAVITLSSLLSLLGCGGAESLAYTNPEWRDSVARSVTFPLGERIELRVGIRDRTIPADDDPALVWLEAQTNIDFVFEVIPTSPGDVELGSLLRSGDLYDLIPEGVLDVSAASNRELFVNFLEFPSLLPYVSALELDDERFRSGLAAKSTLDGNLFSLGSFDPDRVLFAGTLAYRRDIFEKHGLRASTWDEIDRSLVRLKELYPDSYPFGGSRGDIYYTLPALFGSGMSRETLCYFDVDSARWVFGPYEPEFESYVRYLARWQADGLMSPDIFVTQDTELLRYFSSDSMFLTFYRGATGPYFQFFGEGYGGVNENGEWDGTGKWVDSLAMPDKGVLTNSLFSYVGSGWNVYNQSEYVGEAIALLDFLYSPEIAVSTQFGPEGILWKNSETGPRLLDEYANTYNKFGTSALRPQSGTTAPVPFPIAGLNWTVPSSLFGSPGFREYRYFTDTIVAQYRPGIEIPLDPGLRFTADREFNSDRASLMIGLQTFVEGDIAQFVSGQKSLDEWDEFINECREFGADKLVELYNANTEIFLSELF